MTDERVTRGLAVEIHRDGKKGISPTSFTASRLARSYLAVLDELEAVRVQALADRAYQNQNKMLWDENAKLREMVDIGLSAIGHLRADMKRGLKRPSQYSQRRIDKLPTVNLTPPEPEVKK